KACSRCAECRGIALNLLAGGLSPTVAGIDPVELLLAHADWQPGARYLARGCTPEPLPRASAGAAHEMQELRCLAATEPEQVAALLVGARTPADRQRAVGIYARLRAQAMSYEIEPEPGYSAGYLELLPDDLRAGVRAIIDAHFTPAPPHSYERMLSNTRLLAGWITAPLRRVAGVGETSAHRPAMPYARDRPLIPKAPDAVTLSELEL